MKNWKCKSKIRMGIPCQFNCEVKCDFEPRGCLYQGVFQEWEEVLETKNTQTFKNPEDRKDSPHHHTNRLD